MTFLQNILFEIDSLSLFLHDLISCFSIKLFENIDQIDNAQKLGVCPGSMLCNSFRVVSFDITCKLPLLQSFNRMEECVFLL